MLSLVRLGLEHEMQHQELLVYDIKHLLCDQFDAPIQPAPASLVKVEGMAEIEGGLFWLGYSDQVQSPKTKDQSPETTTSLSTTKSPRIRSSCRTLPSTARPSAMATFWSSCATAAIKTFAGGFPKAGKWSTASNGRRRSTGNCTTASG